jgi:hypothetical protein
MPSILSMNRPLIFDIALFKAGFLIAEARMNLVEVRRLTSHYVLFWSDCVI